VLWCQLQGCRNLYQDEMNLKKISLCILGLLLTLTAHASDLAKKLQTSDYVLLMRHALAPGTGDPALYNLEDCATQRNLSAEGRKQAVTIGHWLKKQGVTTVQLYSSPWCRCKDTATLLDFAGFKVEPTLGSFFDEMQKGDERTQALQRFIAEQTKAKGTKALILVTHHVNIFAYMGENIGSGDMVLARVDGAGKMVSYKILSRPH